MSNEENDTIEDDAQTEIARFEVDPNAPLPSKSVPRDGQGDIAREWFGY